MKIPVNPGTPSEPTYFHGEDVIGLLSNGVVLDSHQPTWAYDSCVGHSDGKHQYHYHIPPFCLLDAMGLSVPSTPDWWINDEGTEVRAYADMVTQFLTSSGSSPVIGFARDGFPIFGPYDDEGTLVTSTGLDECNGKIDGLGNYGYYLSVDPPFAPTCLRGKRGVFSYIVTNEVCPVEGITNTFVTQTEIISKCEGLPFENIVDCVGVRSSDGSYSPTSSENSGMNGKHISSFVILCSLVFIAAA